MTLTEILPSLQKLSDREKLKAIQFLATELARDEEDLVALEDGANYEVWSPYDAISAEKILADMLQQNLSASKIIDDVSKSL
jgi:hypothetical protein